MAEDNTNISFIISSHAGKSFEKLSFLIIFEKKF